MKSDSVPAFALEKEALKTEIEAGIQAGVEKSRRGKVEESLWKSTTTRGTSSSNTGVSPMQFPFLSRI